MIDFEKRLDRIEKYLTAIIALGDEGDGLDSLITKKYAEARRLALEAKRIAIGVH